MESEVKKIIVLLLLLTSNINDIIEKQNCSYLQSYNWYIYDTNDYRAENQNQFPVHKWVLHYYFFIKTAKIQLENVCAKNVFEKNLLKYKLQRAENDLYDSISYYRIAIKFNDTI